MVIVATFLLIILLTVNTSCQCPSNCTCSVTDVTCCTSCFAEYYLDGCVCSPCPLNCNSCSVGYNCTVCSDGYYHNGVDCTSCPSSLTNCFTCDNATSCSICNKGSYLNGNSCSSCS